MSPRDLIIGMVFFSQIILGILGNVSLLSHIMMYFTKCRFKSTGLILTNLTIANSLVLLSKGIPQMMAASGLKDFLDDSGCKLVFYVHRVARGVSLGSTCLLSVFQAITIGPRNSRWAELKEKAPEYLGPSNILCWVLHMVLTVIVPMSVKDKWSKKNTTRISDYGYCCTVVSNEAINSLFTALLSFPDILCLGLMLWASSSMVYFLHRHKQRVQHIHRNKVSPRSTPESRATKNILLLVSTFASFYTLSSILNIHLALLNNPSWGLVTTSALISACFPAISPYVLMNHHTGVSMLCFAWIRNAKYPDLC